MKRSEIFFGTIVVVTFAAIGGVVAWVFSNFVTFSQASLPLPAAKVSAGADVAVYNPPGIHEAPADLQEYVTLGHNIIMETSKYAGQYVGNQLTCANCHFQGGITRGGRNGGLSLVGVATKYPKYRERAKGSVDLIARTNSCFERSQNGSPLPADSKEMVSLVTYYHWISKGLPIYEPIPWLGLKKLESDHQPEKAAGAEVYTTKCMQCHGPNGEGTLIAPPLWGQQSFNDGAGMSEVKDFAPFVRLNMPRGNPDLSVAQSLDVAAFVTSRPRPHFSPPKQAQQQ